MRVNSLKGREKGREAIMCFSPGFRFSELRVRAGSVGSVDGVIIYSKQEWGL